MDKHEKAQVNRLQELGKKHGIAGPGMAVAIYALERTICDCPEDIISDADLTAALAMQLAKRIAHHGHEQLAREFMSTSIEIITESRS